MFVRLAAVLSLIALTLAASVGAEAVDCTTGDQCACAAPPAPGVQAIDLGNYHGVVGLYNWLPEPGQRNGVRLICPSTGHCVCAFPPDFQMRNADPLLLRYHLVFSGWTGPFEAYPSTDSLIGADAQGNLLIGPNSFLGANLTAQGAWLRLHREALHKVRIRRNGSPLVWGIEFWASRSFVSAPSKWTQVIAGVDYFLVTTGAAGSGGNALFYVDLAGAAHLFDVSAPVVVRPDTPHTIDFTPP